MPLPDDQQTTFEVIMSGTLAAAGGSSKQINNVFHFHRTVQGDAVSKAALNTIFQTNIGDIYLAAASAGYTQSANTIRCVDDSLDPGASFTQAGVGAIAGDRLPSHSIVTMALRTNTRGRSYMGRKHFAAIVEADTTGDVLTGAGLARWQALRDALPVAMVDAGANTWRLCILSKTLSPSLVNPTDLVSTIVNSVLLNKNVSRLKRRAQKTVR